MAGFVGVFACFVACHQFQHAQRCVGGQCLQGVERQLPARCLGGQVEHLVDLLAWHSLEQGEQRTKCFTDAGGGLRGEALAVHSSPVHGLGQFALTGAECGLRECQGIQRGISGGAVLGLLPGPGGVAATQVVYPGRQFGCLAGVGEPGGLAGGHIQVHQAHVDAIKPSALAQEPAIDLDLRPVQGAVVGGLAGQVTTMGFVFVHPVQGGVVAVSPAPHREVLPGGLQGQFGFVGGRFLTAQPVVARLPLLGGGRGREAQVEVPGFGRKFTQLTHRNDGIG